VNRRVVSSALAGALSLAGCACPSYFRPFHGRLVDGAGAPVTGILLRQLNELTSQRGGVPLLNQSPFIERMHLEAAYGQRWFDFSAWVKTMDPDGRMVKPFFAALLSTKAPA
jgi:hypothetical protein